VGGFFLKKKEESQKDFFQKENLYFKQTFQEKCRSNSFVKKKRFNENVLPKNFLKCPS
jgi:hypothetical protein